MLDRSFRVIRDVKKGSHSGGFGKILARKAFDPGWNEYL